MTKNILMALVAILTLFSSASWSNTSHVNLTSDAKAGAINPIQVQAISGDSEGSKFVSFTATILDSLKDNIASTVNDVTTPFEEWSYNRGIGRLPNSCDTGYSESAGMCAQDCPAGFDSVAGVCWQQCPEGYSNGGTFCTKWDWQPDTITKQSWVQPLTSLSCEAGMTNEAGLCYTPCAESFTGVGPLCFGQFNKAANQQRILDQSAEQHAAALTSSGQGGVVLAEDQQLKLKTDMSFTPIVCGLDGIEGAFGLPIPDPVSIGGSMVDAAGDAIVGSISDAINDNSNSAWFVPSFAQTVLFDFSAQASCADDGTIATSALHFKPSITVKASTQMFDTALHSLTGIDVGIMQVSLYELIPFRIYGTVGTTLATDTTLTSTIDRSQAPVIIEGRQHANVTRLDVTPSMDLWLSSQAYIRITSFLSFIPDLLQIGAEFKLWVMDLDMPYVLEEGVRNTAGINEVYKIESLQTDIESGSGYVNTFLRVLGFDVDAFGDEADVQWAGVSYHKNNFATEQASIVEAL